MPTCPSPTCTCRGQQPALYKLAFRRFTALLRANTLYATTLWGPNEGSGYPYGGELAQRCC
jgi:hypothetical protein